MMFYKNATEQHGHVIKPTMALQNKCHVNDYVPSFSPDENENENTDSELIFAVQCSDDDNIVDDDYDNTGITA